MRSYLEINRAYWDELANRHVESAFYKTAAFRRGAVVLDPIVRERLGDAAHTRILHLQCHFGLDTLSLARMGARVTGLDFSGEAVRAARALAREQGLDADFIECDVLKTPDDLSGFDIVFASWGAICWIADIGAWMRVAARSVKAGGRLLLVEGHPFLMTLDERCKADAPFTVGWPYDSAEPLYQENQGDYADPDGVLKAHSNVQFFHGVAKIVNAAIAAGFSIRALEELDRIPWQGLPQLVRADSDYWTLPPGAPFLPLALVLDAVKDGRPCA